MTERREDPLLDAFAVDVRALMERSVASLYSHLVTRPTGRAVRRAIESQLDDLRGPALSLVDLSAVAILDYSCADEVVAKLLLRYRVQEDRGIPVSYFVLRGVREHHRDPIEAVLDRHALAVVAETERRYELLGRISLAERVLWERVEERRRVAANAVPALAAHADPAGLEALLRRGLLFRDPFAGDLHALSTLVGLPGSRRTRPDDDGATAGNRESPDGV